MSDREYRLTMDITVHDVDSLYTAARKRAMYDGLNTREAEELLLDSDGKPKPEDCILMLIDPGSLAGCDIAGTDVEATWCGAPDVGDLKVFEVTAPDFDGGTDATDERVFWIAATDRRVVEVTLMGLGCHIDWTQMPMSADHADVDFTLPDDTEALIAAVGPKA